jgi:hypothetical protein
LYKIKYKNKNTLLFYFSKKSNLYFNKLIIMKYYNKIFDFQNICDERELRLIKIREAIEQQRELHSEKIKLLKQRRRLYC